MFIRALIVLNIYLCCILLTQSLKYNNYSIKFRPLAPVHLSSVITSSIETLGDSIGNKRLLQEICQFLFNGTNPAYEWTSQNSKLKITIPQIQEFMFNSSDFLDTSVNTSLVQTIPATERKRIEQLAARRVIDNFILSARYLGKVTTWLFQRLNKDNIPKVLKSNDVIHQSQNKSLIVMVDAENVPDFKKYFYVNSDGKIMFSAIIPPKLMRAPKVDSRDDSDASAMSSDISLNLYPYSDNDILVLSYAHAKSPQSAWANRKTPDNRKDAADAMMLFDLGALQHCSSVQHILLITGDKFAFSAAACFDSQEGYLIKLNNDNYLDNDHIRTYNTEQIDVLSDKLYSQPIFKWAVTCSQGARMLGRIEF